MFETLTELYPSVWDEPETKKWTKTAREIQQMFYLTFEGKQWDVYQKKEYELLSTKVCYALFGPPKDANDNFSNIENAYDKDKRDSGDKIKDKIIEVHKNHSGCKSLHVGIIFVCCKQYDKQFYVPIFRIRINETTEESYYVDTNFRVYQSWNDWKENNKLPMLLYCYPKPGFYTCSKGSRYKFDEKGDPKTANGIIKKAQAQYFQEYKSQMTDAVAQETFQKFIDDNYKNIKSGANITRTINTIYDPETFFKSVGPETSIKIIDNTVGIFIINDELKINPNR
ncbi:uncharacterized protein LOC122402178 [Colletes gigas]|uniref:uncharacterized protein LOC122402178 n=1 Tax=Colletes gigas TaxID=935657 RepID=UPI001C9BB033|nr:uncharacterized protein LOC122402178 [Colletes gigas]